MRCIHKPIVIIQGDTFDLEVDLHTHFHEDEISVNRIEFTCKSLGLQKEFIETNDESLWYISLSAEETSMLRVGNFTFDVTAYLENGEEKSTLFHNEVLEVKFKPNKWESN